MKYNAFQPIKGRMYHSSTVNRLCCTIANELSATILICTFAERRERGRLCVFASVCVCLGVCVHVYVHVREREKGVGNVDDNE